MTSSTVADVRWAGPGPGHSIRVKFRELFDRGACPSYASPLGDAAIVRVDPNPIAAKAKWACAGRQSQKPRKVDRQMNAPMTSRHCRLRRRIGRLPARSLPLVAAVPPSPTGRYGGFDADR